VQSKASSSSLTRLRTGRCTLPCRLVDLHFDRIPGNENVPEWAALEYQMNWFRKVLRENLKYRGKRIIFIHGDGDGTLKTSVRRELDEVFAIFCSYTFGGAEQYGTGATVVTVR